MALDYNIFDKKLTFALALTSKQYEKRYSRPISYLDEANKQPTNGL